VSAFFCAAQEKEREHAPQGTVRKYFAFPRKFFEGKSAAVA